MGSVGWAQGVATAAEVRKAIDTGHADHALTELQELRKTEPQAPGLDRLQGLALYATGDLHGAEAAFAAALAKDPKDAEAAQMRGLSLYRLGRPAEAIPMLEGSRGSALTKTDPNYILALCYMDTRRYDDARRAFAAQFGFAPESAMAYLVSARMLLRREYIPVAQQFARKALAMDASLPLAHELLGEIALAGGHTDEAIAELEQERARNPVEAALYNRLGDAYLRAGRLDDAQRALQKDILLEPSSTGAYILMGKTMLKKGDAVAAATYLERARDMDPANYMTHSLLAQAYRALGRADEASREASTVQRLQAASEPKLQSLK